YARAITRGVSAVATRSDADHPLTTERTDARRLAVLVVTADRGQAGAYSASVLRVAGRLRGHEHEEGKESALYVSGRSRVNYCQFRGMKMEQTRISNSDNPRLETAEDIAGTLLEAFRAPAESGGVSELHIVYTQFKSMVSQEAQVVRMLPLEVVDGVAPPGEDLLPLYDFEPSAEEVLDALLPRYIRSRMFNALLQAAASELAARQRAMHTAVDN